VKWNENSESSDADGTSRCFEIATAFISPSLPLLFYYSGVINSPFDSFFLCVYRAEQPDGNGRDSLVVDGRVGQFDFQSLRGRPVDGQVSHSSSPSPGHQFPQRIVRFHPRSGEFIVNVNRRKNDMIKLILGIVCFWYRLPRSWPTWQPSTPPGQSWYLTAPWSRWSVSCNWGHRRCNVRLKSQPLKECWKSRPSLSHGNYYSSLVCFWPNVITSFFKTEFSLITFAECAVKKTLPVK
jgi:hypothetical protein